MKLSHYSFDLPPELIAHHPAPNRDEARLMVVHRDTGEIEHRTFKEIIEYFDEGDNIMDSDIRAVGVEEGYELTGLDALFSDKPIYRI